MLNPYNIKNKKILSIGEGNKGNLTIKSKGKSVKNKSTKKEIYIFKKFAKLYPYSIDLRSIIKKEPPEPDISCSLSDGSIIAFELTEIIDEDLKRSNSDSKRIKEALNNELEQLEENFNNALIYIAFNKEILFRRKKNSIQKIINYLLTLDKAEEGEFKPKDLIDIIRFITISRGIKGPIIDVNSSAWIGDPLKERIKRKFEKEYETESNNIELLAYYELQPKEPKNILEYKLNSLKEFIKNNIKSSVFQRVWIYSTRGNKIIFVYPSC